MRTDGASRTLWHVCLPAACALAALVASLPCGAADEPDAAPLPLVAYYPMEPDAGHTNRLTDAGPLGYHAHITKAAFVSGHNGSALHFNGRESDVVADGPCFDKLATTISVTFWARVQRFPSRATGLWLISKGGNAGWQVGLGDNRLLFFHGSWGGGWYGSPWAGPVPSNQWVHVALTLQKGDRVRIYLNAKEIVNEPAPFAIWPVGEPFRLGGIDWTGDLDELRVYPAQLSAGQVRQDMQGQPPAARAPNDADFPELKFPVRAALARYDMPLPACPIDARARQTAQRAPGPDAVDWPELSLSDGTPLFRESAEQNLEVPLAKDGREFPLFRQPYDMSVEPVGHWFRALPWRWGQYYVYTTDRTARTSSGDYELWAFPVCIAGESSNDVRNVALALGGRGIYKRFERLHSLTLLLPANPPGTPYELKVNDRGPATFSVGLMPTVPGDPKETPLTVDQVIPGAGPLIRLTTPLRPERFPHQKAWEADLAGMTNAAAQPAARQAGEPAPGPWPQLGTQTPRAPIRIFTVSMSAGMSGGHYFDSPHIPGFAGTPQEYAAHIAAMGFDMDFETVAPDKLAGDRDGRYDQWVQALADRGVQAGLNVSSWMLGNPNMAFYSAALPEWHAPLYRDYQLVAQRFGSFANFVGLWTGADNAGYVPYWDWAPPIPNRPWGKAFIEFQQEHPPQVPVGPGLSPTKDYEVRGTEYDFIDFIRRYDRTFAQYGYFAGGVARVNPGLVFTTGSFGSSPGVGGRGGWPWASIPGQAMYAGVPVQTAYDWNEQSSSKPMHLVALIDRLRSYDPAKPTWALVDDFGLYMTRPMRQRAWALALTRGVSAIGTTFLAHDRGAGGADAGGRSRTDIMAEQKELYAWVHRCSGAYAGTEPLASIGILYVHEQAISRPIVGGEDPPDAQLYAGSHEGKVTEALFLCHAAGWPARVITPDAIRRGLPAEMQTILLVGLNKFDETWRWYDGGLDRELQVFVRRGGRILTDDESFCPARATPTGMRVAAYVPQSNADQTAKLLERNRQNIARLQKAMQGVAPPLAQSDDPEVWAIPHGAGEMRYVTVVNQGTPRIGALRWHTDRPIYDLVAGRRLTAPESAACDLGHDAVRLYALPPEPPNGLTVERTPAVDGRAAVSVTVTTGSRLTIRGVPLQITLKQGNATATLYGVSGRPIVLPVAQGGGTDDCVATASELLSGHAAGLVITAAMSTTPGRSKAIVATVGKGPILAFAQRRDVPLTVALTPAQAADPVARALAEKVLEHYRRLGRSCRVGLIAPNDVVLSLQPQQSIQPFPHWRTIASDLVLFGTPADNPLLFDEARGYLLPGAEARLLRSASGGYAALGYAFSPFVGACDAINVVVTEPELWSPAVDALLRVK